MPRGESAWAHGASSSLPSESIVPNRESEIRIEQPVTFRGALANLSFLAHTCNGQNKITLGRMQKPLKTRCFEYEKIFGRPFGKAFASFTDLQVIHVSRARSRSPALEIHTRPRRRAGGGRLPKAHKTKLAKSALRMFRSKTSRPKSRDGAHKI